MRPARPGADRRVLRAVVRALPLPLTDADAAAGYWWELSMRQIEVSRTIVFNQPRHARGFFEALVADNLDIGRPEQVELIFCGSRVRRPAAAGEKVFNTRVVTRGIEVTVNALYKHSQQAVLQGRSRAAHRDRRQRHPRPGLQRRLHNLPELQAKARAANRRLLDTERVGQGCVLASPAFERIAHPTTTVDGRRAPALRFGDPRVQALAGALGVGLHAVTGITNKSLRALMTGLLGEPATRMNRASYDLTRLRRNGLITRSRAATSTDSPTTASPSPSSTPRSTTGCCRPLMATDRPQAPPPVRAALRTIDQHVSARLADARTVGGCLTLWTSAKVLATKDR